MTNMSEGWRTFATNPQLNALASTVIGVLLAGHGLVMRSSSSFDVPQIAMILGGALLLGAGILGVWQPERWGVQTRNPWIGVLNLLAIVMLIVAIVLQIV